MSFSRSTHVCFWMLLLMFSLIRCTSKKTEIDYNNTAAKEYFTTTLLPILESKCNSCHIYHNTSLTQYASFEAVAESIDVIINRTNSDQVGFKMPPSNSDVLTDAEKAALMEFFDLLNQNEIDEAVVSIKWEAFKYPLFSERKGVVGRFETYEVTLQNNATDIFEKLQDAEIKILTNSVKIGDSAEKTSNVLHYFFHHLRSIVHGTIKTIDEDTAVVSIEMNGVTQDISFAVTLDEMNNRIIFLGEIDDLYDFDLATAFEKLDEQCGGHHDGKVWPDVNLKIVIEHYDLL